jgi:hypothetical protein
MLSTNPGRYYPRLLPCRLAPRPLWMRFFDHTRVHGLRKVFHRKACPVGWQHDGFVRFGFDPFLCFAHFPISVILLLWLKKEMWDPAQVG